MAEVDPARVQELNQIPAGSGDYVLYWMQQSQRTRYNYALEFATQMANHLDVPLVVCFGLTDKFPEANFRHYEFMLAGLRDVQEQLRAHKIKFVLQLGSPPAVAVALGKRASAIVCDRGYLRIQKKWRAEVADEASCAVFQVESDVVVPVEVVTNKAEYAARTIRPKIHKLLPKFLKTFRATKPRHSSLEIRIKSEDLAKPEALLARLKLTTSPGSTAEYYRGGEIAAQANLKKFLKTKFEGYSTKRNHPALAHVSHLGMYLHYGQISPVDIALQATEMPKKLDAEKEVFLEELIVRRELTINFVNFTPNYDSYEALPNWTRATMEKHEDDEREHLYSEEQFERAETHDLYWNACMMEMKVTGYMHNYMRMYWGKKVLEWSASPREAYRILIKLNNKYFLCGRDPNAFSNVLWVFGLHDRPWGERAVYGMIRSMAATGLERKTDIMAYVDQVNALSESSGHGTVPGYLTHTKRKEKRS